MNVFYLDEDPKVCAQMHCDKHVVKMIIEYAQLMSTAHRMLDGKEYYGKTKNGRKIKRWEHPTPSLENILYKASHINHPSTIWTRANYKNYHWLYTMWMHLCNEYTIRYGKVHECDRKLSHILCMLPQNIPDGEFTQPTQAMPDQYKTKNSIEAYRKYYIGDKKRFATWKLREVPEWYGQVS